MCRRGMATYCLSGWNAAEKNSSVHLEIVITTNIDLGTTLLFCQFTTSMPDICMYNSITLKSAGTVSTVSFFSDPPIEGVAIECRHNKVTLAHLKRKAINQGLANMVKLAKRSSMKV